MDSCKASKLEAGFAAIYSILRSFNTCTIKSEPGLIAALSLSMVFGGLVSPTSRSKEDWVGAGIELFLFTRFSSD